MQSIHHILRRRNVAEKIERERQRKEEGRAAATEEGETGERIGVVIGLNGDTHRGRGRRDSEDPSLVSLGSGHADTGCLSGKRAELGILFGPLSS